MPNRINDLTGQRFGRLTVLEMYGRNEKGHIMWKCQCDCGNTTITEGVCLRNGHTQSCGCLWKENHYNAIKKYNEYTIDNGVAYVKLSNTNNTMICDADDWNNWKQYCWFENSYNHYVCTTINGKIEKYHWHILEKKEGYVRDHINNNRLDNRRCNLRYATSHANGLNTKLSVRNKSGYKGVRFDNKTQKWCAYIWVNYKSISLGSYENKRDAIIARQKGEEKYHKPILEKETLQTE